MAYEGELLDSCGVINIDFSKVTIVAVSGAGPNVCGHLLLRVDSGGGYYFHAATGDQWGGMKGYPRYMTETGFQKYLKDNNKIVLRQIPMTLPNPNGAFQYLEKLMSERWTWLVLPNNCVAFVEEILSAGGATWTSASNCPSIGTAPTISNRIQDFLIRAQAEIYFLGGVPRYR